MFFVGILST